MLEIAQNAQKSTQAVQQLIQSVETSLDLAKYAEPWEWKEVGTKPTEEKPVMEVNGKEDLACR